jgi:hypothetical protein
LGLEASAGYITEGSAALGIRWGRINSPWWGSVNESANYPALPIPLFSSPFAAKTRELYFSAGVKLRARLYNSFLQGQFRSSALTYSQAELKPLLLESWLGVTTDVGGLQIQYALHYQSAELRSGRGARDLTWAGVTLTKNF